MKAAVRDAMIGHLEATDLLSGLESIGADAVELELDRDRGLAKLTKPDGSPYDLRAEADRQSLGARLEEAGVSPCALLLANDIANRPFEEEIAWTADAVRIADALGAPAVRVDLVPKSKEWEMEPFLDRCIEAMGRALAETEDTGVALGVENHGPITNRPDVLDRVFEGVGEMRMGLTLDTANFYWFGHPLEDVYTMFERYAPRVVHTHVKNIAYPEEVRSQQRSMAWEYKRYCCPVDEGDIDHARVVQLLRRQGYDGPLAVENEALPKFEAEERPDVLRRDLAHVRQCSG